MIELDRIPKLNSLGKFESIWLPGAVSSFNCVKDFQPLEYPIQYRFSSNKAYKIFAEGFIKVVEADTALAALQSINVAHPLKVVSCCAGTQFFSPEYLVKVH